MAGDVTKTVIKTTRCYECGGVLVPHPTLELVKCVNPYCDKFDRYRMAPAAKAKAKSA